MIRRRPTQVFSLAFLDCICCGFGAVILIFVLSVDSREKDKKKTLVDYKSALASQIASIAQLKDERLSLDRESSRLTRLLADSRLKNDSIHSMLDNFDAQLQREKKGQEAMLVDVDDLQKEIAARQKKSDATNLPNIKPAPVGLPIDSNYLVFVIDCSGSMRDPRTDNLYSLVPQKIEEVINSYPQVKGIQFIDVDGRYMITGSRGSWLPDNPGARADYFRQVRLYRVENISNPVPGITRALKDLYDAKNPEMKMSLFIMGDEFASDLTSESALRSLDRLNPEDEAGHRAIVINAIGFPTLMDSDPFSPSDPSGGSQLKFANLIRELCYRHGGAFIALRDIYNN